MKKRNPRFSSYMFMLLNTLVWGAALIIVKPAFDVTTPFRFLLYRFALASIVALPILIYFIQKKMVSWKTFFTVSAIEMIGTTLNLGILYIGVQRTSAIEASLISTTAPLFVILMGIIFLKEKQEKREWLGFVISFAGMIILTLLPILTNGAVSHSVSLFGNLLIIGANIAESSYFITAKRNYTKLPKFLIASISFLVGAVSFSILSLWELNWSTYSLVQLATTELQNMTVFWPVLYMSLFGSLIGLTAYIKGQNNIEASEASLFRYLQPFVYLPLGVLILKEQMYPLQFVGLALILFGVWWAEIRKR